MRALVLAGISLFAARGIPAQEPALQAAIAASSPQPAPAGNAGKWQVQTTTNRLDGSKTVVVGLDEENQQAVLGLLCFQGHPNVIIGWTAVIGSETTPVVTRLGDAKAEVNPWQITNDHKITVYPGDAATFMRQLQTVDRFVAQVTPLHSETLTAAFDVRGLAEAITPLDATCKLR